MGVLGFIKRAPRGPPCTGTSKLDKSKLFHIALLHGARVVARLSRRALRSLLPWAHRARRAVCVLRCSALLAAQHRVRGSITAATTSFQTVLHTSTCTDIESAIAVARITMIRCLPHGRFCQLRVPASRTTLHARRHPCYTHSRHYTPPRSRPLGERHGL